MALDEGSEDANNKTLVLGGIGRHGFRENVSKMLSTTVNCEHLLSAKLLEARGVKVPKTL